MEVEKAAGAAKQGGPLAELAQSDVPQGTSAVAAEGDTAQQAQEADEQVSDTDNDDEGKHGTAWYLSLVVICWRNHGNTSVWSGLASQTYMLCVLLGFE